MKRALRILLRTAVVLVALRVVLWIALPVATRLALRSYDLKGDWDSISLSVLGGELEIRDFEVRDRGDEAKSGEPLLALDYASFDLAMRELLHGRVCVERAEVDGFHLLAERAADGRVAWVKRLGLDGPSPPPPAVDPDDPPPPVALDFSLPIEVRALRLQHCELHVVDASVEPALDATIVASVRVSSLGRSDRAASIECTATSEKLFDSARISGSALGGPRRLDARLELALDGFRPEALAGHLAPLGVIPRARELSCGAEISALVEPELGSQEGSSLEITVRGVHVQTDGTREFAVESVELDAPSVTLAKARIERILVDRVVARASRSSEGMLRVAGFELVGGSSAASSDAPPPSASVATTPFELALGQFLVQSAAFEFDDSAVAPHADLAFALESFEVANVSFNGPPAPPTTFACRASAAGLFRSAELDGSLAWNAANANASLTARVTGLEPTAAAPYFAALGLKSELVDATASVELRADATLAAGAPPDVSVEIGAVRFENHDPRTGPVQLFALDRVSLAHAKLDVTQSAIDVDGLELAHLASGARRDKDGSLHALGFEFVEPVERAAPKSPPMPNAPSAPLALPNLRIARIGASEIELRFDDAAIEPAATFATTEFGGEILGFALGGDAPSTATVKGSLAIPGLLTRASVDGTIATKPGALDVTTKLALRADGMKLTALAPYSKPLGVEPTIDDGAAKVDVSFGIARVDDAWVVDASLDELELANGSATLGSLARLRVAGARLEDSGAIRVDSVEIAKPTLPIEREADGALIACGMRLSKRAEVELAPASEPGPPQSLNFELPDVIVGSLVVSEGSIAWRDAAVVPNVQCSAQFQASLQPFACGFHVPAGAQPDPRLLTHFALDASIGGSIGSLDVEGSASLDSNALHAQGEVRLSGLAAGQLAAYVPPGVAVELRDGGVNFGFSADSSTCESTGRSASLAVERFEFRDGAARLAKFDELRFGAKCVDLAGGVLQLGDVGLRGAEASARRSSDGALHIFGLALTPPNPAPAAAETPKSAPTARATNAMFTRVELGSVELALERFELVDEARGHDAEPLTLAAALTIAPTTLLDATPQDLKPIELRLTSKIAPLVDEIVLDARVSPFASDPELVAKLRVHGIHGAGLTQLAPALAEQLDGSALAAGEFGADCKVVLTLARKSPTELDFSKSFGADIAIENVAFTDKPGGAVLAGLRSAHVEIAKIDPASGDVHVVSIELEKPIGRVSRDAAGIHALGFTLALPEPSGGAPVVAEAPSPAPAPVASHAAEHEPELTIDRVGVSGLDFILTDSTANPPLVAPLTDLDIEVRKFTTRAFSEAKPIHFSVFVGSGKTSLPVRIDSSDALAGTLTALGDVATGVREELKFEERPLFDEVAVNGRLAFYPELNGWVTLGVGALELPAFSGIVAANGVTLGDGLLDASVRVRLQGERGMSVEARPSFSYLSLSEPSGGPISKYLALPAPLDTVLFLLKDAEGQHKVPVNFRVGREGLTTSEMVSAAAGALTSVLARAVSSAPLRMLGSVGGLVGIGGDEEPPPSKDALDLSFAPGVALFAESDRERLTVLVRKLRANDSLVLAVQHKLSASDLTRAEKLANPDLADCRDLSSRLRAKKSELVRRREVLAASARVDYAVSRAKEAAAATDELRAIDRELGLNEDALDRLHELIRPGAERRRDQRTRSAALSIAVERVARVKQALVELGLAADRIEVRSIRVAVEAGVERGSIALVPHRRK